DQGGDLDGDAVGLGGVVGGDGPARLRLFPSQRSQTRPTRADPRLAELRPAPVGRVLEDAPDGRAVPVRLALGAGNLLRLQAAADFADRAALQTDPGEELLHHPRVFLVDLVAGTAAALMFADVAVAVGRAAQDVDRPGPRRVPLAAAAAFEDLGTLVLGHHALDLEQQILFGGLADGPVQEDDLDAGALPLVQEQDLQGVVACQAVRRMDVQPIQGPGGRLVTQ